jgi:crotonobetainyl-CoA:carnitine CoA-transferase CaiB-like acyl-CoA transferase
MIARADILIENFEVGGLTKFGFDFDSLHAAHPALVCFLVTGFGQDGPYASRADYDFPMQGLSSIMDLTGEPEGQP